MMPLKANTFRPRNLGRNPHLPHIMRLCRPRIPLNHILHFTCKHFTMGVARETRRRIRRQHNQDRPVNVAGDIGRDPALVIRGRNCGRVLIDIIGGGGVGAGWISSSISTAAGLGLAMMMMLLLVFGCLAAFAFLGLVAFESEGFDHYCPC